ncbi:MAG: SEC-C domain-containing protein [Bacilli bacterium]|nr:SEC-C domain-containing protein [Bacilli bacterium]MBR3230192.1 SEC-C domain-containing protein [Bacilli bacterium]
MQFRSKLLKYSSKKAQFSNKKLLSCFNSSPCGSGKKYKQCCGK